MTPTGRITVSKPNIQRFPMRTPEAIAIIKAFTHQRISK